MREEQYEVKLAAELEAVGETTRDAEMQELQNVLWKNGLGVFEVPVRPRRPLHTCGPLLLTLEYVQDYCHDVLWWQFATCCNAYRSPRNS